MAKTYNDLYIDMQKLLKNAGVERPAIEARLLMCFASDKTPEELLRDFNLYCGTELEAKASAMAERRVNGEPVAYITGIWEFYSMPLIITSDVLIPRADSETVAEAAIEVALTHKLKRALDLCCGSGCIGLAVIKNIPKMRMYCADISRSALKITKKNAILNGLAARISSVHADALKPPPILLSGFELLVCNPPYIKTGDIAGLDPSVRDYEPRLALDGGADGLRFYRSVLQNWKNVLKPGGFVVFECGAGQADDITAIALEQGFTYIERRKDSLNIDRALVLMLQQNLA